jgi:rRNA pseudouridine-1189 N-methylase Emg1 (Nep1/Mra1 family)
MSRVSERDLTAFAQVASHTPQLRVYLSDQRDQVIKFLTAARDPVALNRYQGDLVRLNSLIELLDTAGTLLKPK